MGSSVIFCYRHILWFLSQRHIFWRFFILFSARCKCSIKIALHAQNQVRYSRTRYLLPARDGPGALPDGRSSWDAAVAVVAVSCQNVTLISFSFRAWIGLIWEISAHFSDQSSSFFGARLFCKNTPKSVFQYFQVPRLSKWIVFQYFQVPRQSKWIVFQYFQDPRLPIRLKTK